MSALDPTGPHAARVAEIDRELAGIDTGLTQLADGRGQRRRLGGDGGRFRSADGRPPQETARLLKARAAKLRAERDALTGARNPAPPAVTDHALVRWLERVKGFDVDAWREECAAWAAANPARAVERDGRLVTVAPARKAGAFGR